MYEITEGTKYQATKNLGAVEIAKLIRADIKAATKAGELPAGLKLSIRSDYNSINVRIVALPFNPISASWAALTPAEQQEYWNAQRKLTDEAKRIQAVLTAIHGAYNYDGSDIQSDYFNVRYYGSVSFDWGLLRQAEIDAVACVPTMADYVAAAAEAQLVAENGELLAYLAQREVEIAAFQVEEAARQALVADGEATRAAALAAHVVAPAAGPRSVYAVAITILWSESTAAGLEDGACYVTDAAGSAWGKIESVLRAAALDAPADGCYDKTKFRIDWSTGSTYEGRIDLQRQHADMAGPLAAHVAEFVGHIAGLNPAGNVYRMDAEAIQGWAAMLTTHIMGADLPAAVVEAAPGNAPTLATVLTFRPRQEALPLPAVAGELAPCIAGPAVRVVNEDAARFRFFLGLED